MLDVVYRIKYFSFWKNVDNMKPEKILCNCEHHFLTWIICLFISGDRSLSGNQMIS
jgi:hypothetical protein